MTEAKHHDKDDDSSRRPCCDDDSKREGWVSHVTGANFGENFSDHLYTGNLQQGSFIKISCNPDARSSNSQLLLLISILCWGDTQKLLPWLNNSPYRLPGASVQVHHTPHDSSADISRLWNFPCIQHVNYIICYTYTLSSQTITCGLWVVRNLLQDQSVGVC